VQQHLGRQAGVSKVDVNLIDGKVAILLKDDIAFDPLLVLKATYDSGVTVEEMIMTASGKIESEADGSLWLRINPAQRFELARNAKARDAAGSASGDAEITVRGRLYKMEGKKQEDIKGPLRLEVLEVVKRE
jgi:hypothetical protein